MATREERFSPKIGQALVAHMEKGFSFRTFCAESNIAYSTLCKWAEQNQSFKKFKEIAEAKSQLYWETVGIAASQGNLRKLVKETVRRTTRLDSEGHPVLREDGSVDAMEQVVERSYEAIPLAQTMWVFIMKSRFGYRDDGGDAFNPDNPAQTGTKTFQLAYNLTDPAYVVKNRPAPTQGESDGKATAPAKDGNPAANPPPEHAGGRKPAASGDDSGGGGTGVGG